MRPSVARWLDRMFTTVMALVVCPYFFFEAIGLAMDATTHGQVSFGWISVVLAFAIQTMWVMFASEAWRKR